MVATRFARLRRHRDRHYPMVATRFARLRRPRDRHYANASTGGHEQTRLRSP
jgi:hypothetical protein